MAKTAPKYALVTDSLRELAATLKPGDRFLSHAEVARRYGVSDGTALRALDTLRRDGWIARHNGVGTFVADNSLAPADTLPAVAAPQTIAALALSSDGFFQNCVRLVTEQASEQGLAVVCHYAHSKANFADALPLEALHPQGFLIFSYDLVGVAAALRERGHRVVIVGVPPADTVPVLPCVYSDHEQGASLVARHLLDLGHRRIAFVRCGDDAHAPDFSITATRRWRGHVRTLRAAGVDDPQWLIPPADILRWQEEPRLAADLFSRSDAPTALVAWNDGEAMTLCHLLRRAGIRVPEDVSIIGYDNLPAGTVSDPPLDTVEQHLGVQLRHALALLQSDISPQTASTIAIPTLIPRGSCAAPAR